MQTNDIITDSFNDVLDDLLEIRYLFEDKIQALEKFLHDIKNKNYYQNSNTFHSLVAIAEKVREILYINLNILNIRTTSLENLISLKNSSYEAIRTLQSVSSSLFTSLNYQSPSFLYSDTPQAGADFGRIVGNENDYKRDVHLDGNKLENKYKKEYVDCPYPYKWFVKTYACSSGMSAFTTVLNFLQTENILKTKALIGRSTYFESKLLITNIFKGKIIEVDESDTAGIIKNIKTQKPEVLFLDSLGNSSSIPVCNLPEIFTYLKEEYNEKISIVLDNTGLSLFFQPIPFIASKRNKITLYSYESLNKYVQFGLDRVTGGMITAYGNNIGKLFKLREHLGTNLPDNSVYSIPNPNRKLLKKRILRLGRNAFYLAHNLQKQIEKNKLKKIISVVYPSLSNHPCFRWSKSIPFCGSYFTFEVARKYQNQKFFKSFLKKTIAEAKKRKVQIIAGSSFGLNTTRIYITALNSEFGEPFIRISVGTESMAEMEKIKEVLISVLQSI